MVIANRKSRIYYPRASQIITELQESILQILHENGIKDRIIYPITSKLTVFDVYDDIKKEFLVDFSTSDEEVIVFNPEYFTVIKDYNNKYLQNIKDHTFHYIQQTLAYTSPERKDIKEDLVIGFTILNPSDISNSWTKLTGTFSEISKAVDDNAEIHFKNDRTVECKINGVTVGFGRNDGFNHIMEAHFSLTDIYSVILKRK